MDIAPIVSELKRERDRLSRAIAALERTAVAGTDLEKRAARALFVRKAKKRGRLNWLLIPRCEPVSLRD